MPSRIPHRPAAYLVGLALVLAAVLLPAAAQAATKPYTVAVSPASVAAGSRATFTAHFSTPASAKQQLGAARLTAPSGLAVIASSVALGGKGTVAVAGNVVTLNGLSLQPGRSVDLTLAADVPCTSDPLTWTVAAKQANEFNGLPGNELTLVQPSSLTTSIGGRCALRFASQPANARTGEAISTTPYASGPAVSVEVIDGAGNRVTGSSAAVSLTAAGGPGVLTGGGPVSATLGLAPFPALALDAAGQYTLVATSPGLASATSRVFRIDTVATACVENVNCSATTSTPTTKADVTAEQQATAVDAGFLTLSFNAGLAIDCAGYTEASPDTALLDFTSANRAKTATLTVPRPPSTSLYHDDDDAPPVQFCFGSPVVFVTRAGVPATQQGTYDWNGDGIPEPVFVGLLPDCSRAASPCVSQRAPAGPGLTQITARIPAGLGDPGMRG